MAARGVNKVILVGNLGQDPEVRAMPSGDNVCNLSLATSEQWKDKQGQPQERTEWHRVVFFGKPADIIAQYAQKGTKLYVEGQLATREWEKDGVKRYTTEIKGREFQFLGGGIGQDAKPAQAPAPTPEPTPAQDFGSFDDDIPF